MGVSRSSPTSSVDGVLSASWQVARRIPRTTRGTILIVRWATIAVLLVLALVDPQPGWEDLPAWAYVLIFAGYALLTDLLQTRWTWYRDRPQLAVLDLVVAGGFYLLGWTYAGPLYTLVVLVVISAAAILPPRGAVRSTRSRQRQLSRSPR